MTREESRPLIEAVRTGIINSKLRVLIPDHVRCQPKVNCMRQYETYLDFSTMNLGE